MDDIVENFAEKLGIEPNAAKQSLSITSKYILQVSEPSKISSLFPYYHQVI
jgi:hypothetical protein